MLNFFTKRICFYLLFTLIFSSTLQADRMKNLDSYYNDVKKSAEEVGFRLKNVKSYMNEIYKPDYFLKKTFLGVKPRWYTANGGYYTFTTVYPYEIKNTVFKKKIRGVLLEDKQSYSRRSIWTSYIELNMYSLRFLEKNVFYNNYKRNLINSLKDRIYPNSNINQVLLELKKHEDKISVLVKNNIYMNVKNLSKNVHHTNIDFMKKARNQTKPFNMYDKDDEIIKSNQHRFKLKPLVKLFNDDTLLKYGKKKKLSYANNYTEALEQMIYKMSKGKLKIEITINNHQFKIVSYSKKELYNKESKFLSILDEYEEKGFCYKFSPKGKTFRTIYQSIKGKGYIEYDKAPNNKKYFMFDGGYWATSIWSSRDELLKVTKNVEDEYKKFVKLAKEYHQLALERIIEKYTDKSESRKEFGNEF